METLFNRHLRGDRTIWMVALFLGMISLLAVYSAIASLAFKQDTGSFRFLFKHFIMLASGGLLIFYASRLRFGVYGRLSELLIWLTAGMLLLTLLLGSNINDASRWMRIPGLGVTFQTSDLAKLVLIVYLARVLSKYQEEINGFRMFLVRVGLPIGLICGLILPANFSTAALLFFTCLAVLFIAEVPIRNILGLIGIAIGSFILLLTISEALPDLHLLPRVETWQARIENHNSGDSDANYQVEHAKIAIASGGILPNGPGSGTSRNFLPHPYSDMIYAFIVEEYGSLFGGIGLILLYLILLYRSIRIAHRCEKRSGALLAFGLSFGLVVQAMVNMAVAVDLVPVTGQPLPLVSMGGTSIWFTCLAIGIILSVSRSLPDMDEAADNGRPRTTNA